MFKAGDHVKWKYYHGIFCGSGIIKKIVNRESKYAVIDTGKIDGLCNVPLNVLEYYDEEKDKKEEPFLANDPIHW